ncbi:MAG: hypothetical protein U0640_05705 [Phycisphaerales bacterium]
MTQSMFHRVVVCGAVVGIVSALGGCQVTRLQKLHAKSDKVERNLVKERDRVLKTDKSDERQPRLAHLSSLHGTLSLTNVALGTIPLIVPADQRDVAYDVIDEAYDTIDWNIPLGPNDAKKPMPMQLQGSALRLQ